MNQSSECNVEKTGGSETDVSDIRLEKISFIIRASALISGQPPKIAQSKIETFQQIGGD